MLIEYTVANFRSIADEVKLSMIPVRGNSKPYNIMSVDKNDNIKKLLRSCTIYGANGSGKTNVILALSKMKSLVLHSKNQNAGQSFREYQPFILNSEYSDKPVQFGITFIKDNIIYKYEFSFTKTKITFEKLSYFKGKKVIEIFRREENKLEPFIDHDELQSLFSHTGENVLFVSKANNEYKKFGPVFKWFNEVLSPIGPLSRISEDNTIEYMNQSEENKKKLIKFLQYADFDIYNISGKIERFDDPAIFDSFKTFMNTLGAKIDTNIISNKSSSQIEFGNSEIKSVRKRVDDTEVIVNFSKFESDGTQQFFKLASIWLQSILESDKVLIIDEFDILLHPDLQNFLLKVFHDPELIKTKSQIIFTTHNTNILASNFFRREQIWFTEKNIDTKSTELYSLLEYEKRHDRSVEKAYLFGRYGGLPDLKYGKF
ncbi:MULTISPECIES: ATP/GTP-binding protein [unclassified Methanoregula]|uniref:AAA family ATPase n=1 Tax=unclassified Methanoregula TaxID=2649730 RepID=UPI0009CFCBB1|nr:MULTISPECIES: ATP-binding protein [unclassified Methanoregula]OPX63195.1 MAG: hypothetical protein A4E33_01878 [Methanoregula sp. PtaB.Bin085]OPY33495.1 MAG: hypothetical protein A4E34_01818 [Methanoregula sp. PtaU1.Bin006]